MTFEVVNYGKSMYGGWYAEYGLADSDGVFHYFGREDFDRMRDLKEWASECGAPLYEWRRYDNA